MRNKLLNILLCLILITGVSYAKWVRYEAEDAKGLIDTEVVNNSEASGGKEHLIKWGQIDFEINVPMEGTYPMRYSMHPPSYGDMKADRLKLNGEIMQIPTAVGLKNCEQQYAGGVDMAPPDWYDMAKWNDFKAATIVYGENTKFQVISRWWNLWDGDTWNIPMTVTLKTGRNVISVETQWAWTYYDYLELDLPEMAYDPTPADKAVLDPSEISGLCWKNPTEFPVSANEVYFGNPESEPNATVFYQDVLTKLPVVTNPGENPCVEIPAEFLPLQDNTTYYWVVDTCRGNCVPGEPNYPGAVWEFTVVYNLPPDVDAGADQYVWLGKGGVAGEVTVDLDATVVDVDALTYTWTKVSGPDSATINSPSTEDTSVIITAVGDYEFKLVADDGKKTGEDTVMVIVTDTSCQASHRMPDSDPYDAGDINQDCFVDMSDLALMAMDWALCTDVLNSCQ